ncbi:sialidase family protein [Klebsiella quasipneumoniae]|uniref:WD40/YVTN/BNR-like repeat-containing protein n=1 Tax=Klebsiella quasipneumoniae TaxID=1463165 RepID=UPI001E623CB3|nr:sialidase family protein [Klebsiella quasipneumoniae]
MVERYNTGNSRPSNSMKDLSDNAQAYDDFMNSENDTFIDRLENEKDTLAGAQKKMAAAAEASVQDTRQNLIPLSRQYMTLTAAQADIANIPMGSTTYYRSPDDSALAIEVINNAGTLEPTGRKMPSSAKIDAVSELVFSEPALSPLMFLADAEGNNVGVFLSDGSFYLIGMSGALQDQYAIRHAVDIRSGINRIEGISELVGSDLSSLLSSSCDAQGVPFLSFSPDGGLFLRGMVGALQDLYAIKHAADIKAGIASIETVEASVEAMKPKLTDRVFYALNKSGELVSQAVRVGRVTRRQKTGYNLNSWPQGKLCIDSNGRIYCGYNSAPSHGGSGTVPMLTRSDDDGVSWSDPIQIVTGENYARGTDWWSLGVDGDDNLWGIVRSRGANNRVGVTFYNLYKSTDGGTSWVKIGEISSVTQVISDIAYVPELFHDMCYIPSTGRMVTGYHFANSSRVGFMSFNISDPLNTIVTQDVISHGEMSSTTYCEPTIAVDYTQNPAGIVYGGLRTQISGASFPSQLYFMNVDMTGFTRFNAPESVQYSPMAIRRINGQFILLTVERYNTGAMNLWFGTPTDFYGMAPSNFWKMPIGKIVDEVTVGASNVGVQDMEIHGDKLYFAWSSETKNTYADTYIGKMNIVYPASLINNEYLEGL